MGTAQIKRAVYSMGGAAVRPYVSWFGIANPSTSTQHQTRGSFGSGIYATSPQYQGPGTVTSYTGQGTRTPFTAGNAFGSSGSGYQNPNSGLGELTTYTYPASGADRPHAVTSLTDKTGTTVGTFSYDANGNMITRVQNGVSWTHTFDAENRLVTVTGNGTTTTYVYDGAGNRVKRIVQSGGTTTTTVYVAGMEIEYSGSTETKRTVYYSMGGAFRVIGGTNAGVYYRHGDHLGSTSLISNASGNKVAGSEVVYAPSGEVRTGDLNGLAAWTDFGFTGQKHDLSTGGLMYYGARYYLPGLRRFISADTIIPQTTNPQAFNRYSYVSNRVMVFNDPTGHEPEPYSEEWWIRRYYDLKLWLYEDPGHEITTQEQLIEYRKKQLDAYGVYFEEGEDLLTLDIVNKVWFAVTRYGMAIQAATEPYLNMSQNSAFVTFMGRTRIDLVQGSYVSDGRYAENNRCWGEERKTCDFKISFATDRLASEGFNTGTAGDVHRIL